MFFDEFIKNNEKAKKIYQQIKSPKITIDIIDECLNEIPIEVDSNYIRQFILNGQTLIQKNIYQDN